MDGPPYAGPLNSGATSNEAKGSSDFGRRSTLSSGCVPGTVVLVDGAAAVVVVTSVVTTDGADVVAGVGAVVSTVGGLVVGTVVSSVAEELQEVARRANAQSAVRSRNAPSSRPNRDENITVSFLSAPAYGPPYRRPRRESPIRGAR